MPRLHLPFATKRQNTPAVNEVADSAKLLDSYCQKWLEAQLDEAQELYSSYSILQDDKNTLTSHLYKVSGFEGLNSQFETTHYIAYMTKCVRLKQAYAREQRTIDQRYTAKLEEVHRTLSK